MKNFSPIVGFRVHQWFDHWAVSAIRSDGSTERFHVCQDRFDARSKMRRRAEARGFTVRADGDSCTLPEEA